MHFIMVPIVGVLRGSEIGIAVALPFAFSAFLRKLRDRRLLALLVLGVLWLFCQFASDIFNKIPREQSLRGLANIASILGAFVFFIGCYSISSKSHWFYLLGRVVSGVLSVFLFRQAVGNSETSEQFWDHYVGDWGLLAFIVFASLIIEYSPYLVIATGVMYGALAIGLGGRADGAIALFASALIAYSFLFKPRLLPRIRAFDIVRFILYAMIVFVPIHITFVSLALRGTLGKASRRQVELSPNPYNPIYFLLSVRSESLVSIQAIKDKPLLGHGSWAYNPQYDALYSWHLTQLKGVRTRYFNKYRVIPSHSVLLGAWVHGGVIGAVFWLYASFLVLVEGVRHMQYGSKFSMLVACVFIAMCAWHILFSPMSFARYAWPANLAFLLCSDISTPGRLSPKGTR